MRIRLLTHDPEAASFRVRWGTHLPLLAARGHEVVVDAIPRRGRRALLERARDADLVVLQRRLLRAPDFARLRRAARRLVYDFDDALCFSPDPPHRSRTREWRFFRAVGGADAAIAGNRYLAALARLRARRVFVVPDAVDVARFAPRPKLERLTAVWIGQRATLRYLLPVVDAVRRAGFALRVIADEFPPGVEAVPWSPATEAEKLAECHVGLMPLTDDPFARGKCGYKLLQYAAAGLPSVVSPIGAGRALSDLGAVPARAPAEWEAALRGLADPASRDVLGVRARTLAALRHAPDRVGERLARVLESIVR